MLWEKDVITVRVMLVSPLGMCLVQREEVGQIQKYLNGIKSSVLLWRSTSTVVTCVFCYLGTNSLQHTPKISKEIKQPMFARNCSVGFFFFFTETDCFEVTAFNLWNSPNSQRSTWLILHPSVKQTDLGSYLASFFGNVFTAGAFARTLIWRQYSVSHCLFSFPS